MRKILIFSILATLIVNTCSAGGGWVYKKGSGFFKLGQNVIHADKFFDTNGEIIDIVTVGLYTSSLYAEYGLTDKITLNAYIPFFVRSTLNKQEFRQSGQVVSGDEMNAFGDTNVGFKYGLRQDKEIVISVGLTLGLPIGETMGGEGRILQSGDGEFNQLGTIEASHSFYPKPFYISTLLGFNNRTRGFSDEIHFGAELGYTPSAKVTAILRTYAVNSLFNGDGGASMGNGIFSNDTEYFSFGPELIYGFTDSIGLTAAAGFAFSGRRILAAPNWSLGFYMKL